MLTLKLSDEGGLQQKESLESSESIDVKNKRGKEKRHRVERRDLGEADTETRNLTELRETRRKTTAKQIRLKAKMVQKD